MNISCQHCQSSNIERRGQRADKQRCLCKDCSRWFVVEIDIPDIDSVIESHGSEVHIDKHNRFIITSAQNNTPVDVKWWKSINAWANHHDSQILVIPIFYKVGADEDLWWAPEVLPYLITTEVHLGGVRVYGDTNITPTAVNPLSGFDSISQGDSAIFGSTQIQMKTVATPQNRLPKILQTTGTTTFKNYRKCKTGKKGDFHHSLGAAIVELDGDVFHLRSVTGDNKSEFYDLDLHCTPRGVKKVKSIEAIVVGDEHVMWNCPDVRAATFDNEDSIVNTLNPKYIVRHDVIDAYSVSHHHKHSPSIKFKKFLNGTDDLKAELDQTATFIEETTPKGSKSVIVPSNHHNHIKRWLEEVEWRSEPWNARLYHQLWDAWLEAIEKNESFHPFTHWMKNNCGADVLYLTDDYPFIIKDIYVGYHGDKGINGARGTINSFAKIGSKTIVGHTHSPGIDKGCFMIGTSSKLNLEYTSGPSSWMNTHAIIHANGKRQLINIVYGEWRMQ